MTVSYTINNESISHDELKSIRIEKKDYIEYMESIRKKKIFPQETKLDKIS